MKKIPLTRGLFAKVDDTDYERVSAHKWTATATGRYAVRTVTVDGKQRAVLLHRFLTSPGDGFQVDHIDGDGLNNVRGNLRVCRHVDNNRNRLVAPRDLPVGVAPHKNRWKAQVGYNGKSRHLGVFGSIPGAALAYVWAASRLFGEFYKQQPIQGRKQDE